MSRIEELADRDGWVCWLCEGPIDRDAPDGSPGQATVDHVVPRSRGGRTELANLRLAHRRCNGVRGNHLPELDWPERFAAIDPAPVWQSLARIVRRGRPEIVALVPTRDLAEQAAAWVQLRAERFVGGQWTASVEQVGASERCAVHLSLTGDPDITDLGRPTGPPSRTRRPRG